MQLGIGAVIASSLSRPATCFSEAMGLRDASSVFRLEKTLWLSSPSVCSVRFLDTTRIGPRISTSSGILATVKNDIRCLRGSGLISCRVRSEHQESPECTWALFCPYDMQDIAFPMFFFFTRSSTIAVAQLDLVAPGFAQGTLTADALT